MNIRDWRNAKHKAGYEFGRTFLIWLAECWQRKPYQQACDVCGRKVWLYGGDGGALVCSDGCEYEFRISGKIIF